MFQPVSSFNTSEIYLAVQSPSCQRTFMIFNSESNNLTINDINNLIETLKNDETVARAIMTQTKDMLLTTSEFLKGMGDLSKDMSKLCNDKEFNKVAKSFQEAMYATEQQTERLDMFLDESKDSFANLSTIENKDTVKDDDINSLLDNEISTSIQGDDDELAKLDELLKKKLEE